MHGRGCPSPWPERDAHPRGCGMPNDGEEKNGLAPKAQVRGFDVTLGATAAMPVGTSWQNPDFNVGGFPQLRPPTSEGVSTSFADSRKPPRGSLSVRPNYWCPAEHESHTEQTCIL